MKAIKDRRNIYAALCAAGTLLTVLFIAMQSTAAAIICGGVTIVALILLYRQSRLLCVAALICDNRILTVPSSVVTTNSSPDPKRAEETIVSTFGMLLGSKVYRWGCEGVYGVRLREVKLDREHLRLSFGDDNEMICVDMPHGITDKDALIEVKRKLWRETGVKAEVCGW